MGSGGRSAPAIACATGHSWRKTFTTQLHALGVPLAVVSRLLGHASISHHPGLPLGYHTARGTSGRSARPLARNSTFEQLGGGAASSYLNRGGKAEIALKRGSEGVTLDCSWL
ncbi:MAG TPA: hypothetical protein ENI60_05750 [Candidatus Fraserbacteria bacterium]|nr:hypothetical protein [Candidatus Fraserbacteria bacterium]